MVTYNFFLYNNPKFLTFYLENLEIQLQLTITYTHIKASVVAKFDHINNQHPMPQVVKIWFQSCHQLQWQQFRQENCQHPTGSDTTPASKSLGRTRGSARSSTRSTGAETEQAWHPSQLGVMGFEPKEQNNSFSCKIHCITYVFCLNNFVNCRNPYRIKNHY